MVALVVSERLSVEELRDAARWEHRGKVRARLLAMARLREGGERSATARQFGMSRNVLRIWVGRYNATGIAGLVDCRILDIRALAEREFGVRYSHGGMHRVLRAIGCAWLMPRPHHPKGDAEAQDEFKKNSRKWSRTSPASIPASR